ncbi:signal transduction histidine kinase [Caulobacter ginsengisoli]|uniref:histidine kinase n=1 Tax=Caulobacter ginsengisoli TaxID=400775 RepID=A0ABU0IR74_9CAUL|nr:sensor histidine kinase [Caulobacter ginsengisoli]MDQ0463514.1 signal transduction histidine kinase [Caulobacter ginsengisoli]
MTFGDIRRSWSQSSLVGRLVLLATGWSLLALIITGVLLTTFFQQAALRRFDQPADEVLATLNSGVVVEDGQVVAPPLIDARATRAYSGRYWALAEPTPSGAAHTLVKSHSLFDKDLTVPRAALAQAAAKPGTVIRYDTVGPLNQPLRASLMQITLKADRPAPVLLLVAEDRTPVDQEARRFAIRTALALMILGAGVLAAVLVQVRIGLSPLFTLRREVADVRKGKADRLVGTYPSELAPLANELNALVAHNQDVVERQRTHVGNLAHALKTPLSVMLTEAQQQPGQLAQVVSHQADLMREQVDHHLRRARAAARAQTMGERTLVEPVLDELSRTLEKIFRDKGLEIDWVCPDDLCFRGERQDFLEIAGNVMENAGKFCKGRVRVTAQPDGPGRFRLTVEDDGSGLPPDRRGEVLKRGARLDESAPGSGLGLAIVDELARAYGGGLELAESALGGLKVVLTLPSAEN